jgi:hypothetical protein
MALPVECPLGSPGVARKETNSLFRYDAGTHQVHLTKRRTNKIFCATWTALGRPALSVHSFWVRGATLCSAIGVKVDKIKALGRWTSDCYKLYIKPLTEEAIIDSLCILQDPSP